MWKLDIPISNEFPLYNIIEYEICAGTRLNDTADIQFVEYLMIFVC